jgi:hypothetical protein
VLELNLRRKIVSLATSCSSDADDVWEQTQINIGKETLEKGKRANKSNGNQHKWTRWFVLPRFGSKEPNPRWGGHKGWVYFNPFPLSNGRLDWVSLLLITRATKTPQGPPHTWCLLLGFTKHSRIRMRKEEGNPSNKSANEHKNSLSLSQVTKWWSWFWDLERILIYWMCLGVKSFALVLNVEFRTLGWLWMRWLGGIYRPQPLLSRWLTLLSMGAPDSPVAHQTVTVHCLVRATSARPLGFGAVDHWSALSFCCTG